MGKKQLSKSFESNVGIGSLSNKFSLLTSDGRKKNKENVQKEKKTQNEKQINPKNEKKKNNNNKINNLHNKVNNSQKITTLDIKSESGSGSESDDEDVDCLKNNIFNIKKETIAEKIPSGNDDDNDEEIIKNEEDIIGKNKYLNSRWTVWVHRNDCPDWTVNGYQFIWTIDSLSSFWRFFNNFQKINKEENQFFIMRDKIKPIYEDNHNRKGGRCSLKLDCYDRNNKNDSGCEVMEVLCLLIMNETLIPDTDEINGISYSIKNRSILIKLWTKEFENDIKEKLPKNLINKISSAIKNHTFRRFDNNISVRYTKIEPEYEEQQQ